MGRKTDTKSVHQHVFSENPKFQFLNGSNAAASISITLRGAFSWYPERHRLLWEQLSVMSIGTIATFSSELSSGVDTKIFLQSILCTDANLTGYAHHLINSNITPMVNNMKEEL